MTTKALADSTTATNTYAGSGMTLANTGVQGAPGASGLNFGFVVSGKYDTLINNGTVFGQRVGVYVTGSGDSSINSAGKKITATGPDQAAIDLYSFSDTITDYGVIGGYANAINSDPAGNAAELKHGGVVTNVGTLLNSGALVGGGVQNRHQLGRDPGQQYLSRHLHEIRQPSHQSDRRRDFSEWCATRSAEGNP